MQGNYIGTDVSGDAKILGNFGFGVRITGGSGDLIGGPSPGSLNVITGNFGGINVIQVTNSTIRGNRIGIGKSDNALLVGNSGIGVLVTSSTGITIGGTTDAARNFIVNNNTGVTLVNSSSNSILGNRIQDNDGIGISIINSDDNAIGGTATDAGNRIDRNNTGVSITNGNRNSISGNSFTENMGIGVAIASGNSNPILNNTFSKNGFGIDLGPSGPTLNNSSGHNDANHLQNFPELISITTSPDGTSTRILGQLKSSTTPNTTFIIQLFEDMPYPSGFGQGMIFDEVRVMTNAEGNASIDVTVPMAIPKGQFISATATNLTTNDTSEFSPQITEISYTVTTVADNGDDSAPTPGSLRAAIRNAIANANGIQGARMIDFKIPGQGPFTIAPPRPLPTITVPVNIDGYTQPGASPNTLDVGDNAVLLVELNGANAGLGANGLTIFSGNSTVKGLVINSFRGAGIALTIKGGDVIAGNYLGTDFNGTMSLPNDFGVTIIDVSSNTIGGTTDADRNLISGNRFDGVLINTSQGMATDNVVEGNYIGTDVNGTGAMANGLAGVAISASTLSASNNTIGGTTPAARNVISGNSQPDGSGVGVQILGAAATENLVEGNFIGLDVSGTSPLSNDTGVLINGAADNIIGGMTTRPGTGPGNVISSYIPSSSSNTGVGVLITGPGATDNRVEGNLFGTDERGTRTLVADQAGLGILISNTSGSNTVGGKIAARRNIIAGFNTGIEIFAPQSPLDSPAGSMIWGNYIGTDVDGKKPLGNRVGVYINAASSNKIGDLTALPGTGPGNVISGNLIGIYLLASTTMGNQIQGNLIGLDAAGKAPLGNYIGIFLDAASDNTIGGKTASARNVIAGNRRNNQDGSIGIYFFNNAADNVVANNFIGTNVNGNPGRDLGQGNYGVLLYNAPKNTVSVSGKNANLIRGSGIAATREFTGPTPPSQSAGSGSGTSASGGTKRRPQRLSSGLRRRLRASWLGGGSRGQTH